MLFPRYSVYFCRVIKVYWCKNSFKNKINEMDSEILEKERALHKMNAELELRVQELMKEINSVMKIPEKVYSNNSSVHKVIPVKKKSSLCDRDLIPEVHLDEVLPVQSGTLNPHNTMRLLKARVKALEEENKILEIDNKNKREAVKNVKAELQKNEDLKMKYFQQVTMYKDQLVKQSKQLLDITERLTQKDLEINSLKKEVDMLKKQLKVSQQSSGNIELRLNRSLELAEKLKEELKESKLNHKDVQESSKRNCNYMKGAMKLLEKQKEDLVKVYFKQMKLIENLRKQKACLEIACVTNFAEQELNKLLEWNLSDS